MSKKTALILITAMVISGCTFNNSNVDRSSREDKICSEDGYNKLILEAIEKKYPESEIIEVFDSFSLSSGPYWKLKIKTKMGETVRENIQCHYQYSTEECRKREDDHCYISVARFHNDIEICKEIISRRTKNNCFALFAGLSAPDDWTVSICENLNDMEAQRGCVEFFQLDTKTQE